MAKAVRMRYRELSRFEHQLIALNTLRLSGESALAIIGSLSLVEHLLNGLSSTSGRSKNLSGLLKFHQALFAREDFTTLEAARMVRNKFVHDAPPARESLTSTNGSRAGREAEDPAISELADHTIRAAFTLYRKINLQAKSRASMAAPNHA